jgi:hypothetical protein
MKNIFQWELLEKWSNKLMNQRCATTSSYHQHRGVGRLSLK